MNVSDCDQSHRRPKVNVAETKICGILIAMLDPNDPSTYDAELDYYFNQYDSDCQLKSLELAGLVYAFDADGNRHRGKRSGPDMVRVSSSHAAKAYSDPWANPDSIAAFARGRAVWRRVKALPGPVFERLQRWYTLKPRDPEQNWGVDRPSKTLAVWDHELFRRLQVNA